MTVWLSQYQEENLRKNGLEKLKEKSCLNWRPMTELKTSRRKKGLTVTVAF